MENALKLVSKTGGHLKNGAKTASASIHAVITKSSTSDDSEGNALATTAQAVTSSINSAKDAYNNLSPESQSAIKQVAVFGGGAAAAVCLLPAAAAAVGFGSAGISASSTAASLMSMSWKAQAGMGLISTAQSVGAAGVSGATAIASGSTSSAVYNYYLKKCKDDNELQSKL